MYTFTVKPVPSIGLLSYGRFFKVRKEERCSTLARLEISKEVEDGRSWY